MADVYDQQIEAPDFSADDYINDDGYSKRRTKALESFNAGGNVEQDATILAAIHNDINADEWMGMSNSVRGNAKYIPAANVSMQITNSHHHPPPPPPPPGSDSNLTNQIIKSVESDFSINDNDENDSKRRKKTYDINDVLSAENKEEKFKPSICTHFIVLIFVSILFGGSFYYFYLEEWPQKFYNMSYAAIGWTLCVLFLFLNFFDLFHKFHESFSALCQHKASTIFVALTIIFGLIEYILWSLESEQLFLNRDLQYFNIWLIVIDIIWYIFFFCLFCSAMSNWPTLSYYLSESAWIHGLLYMSLIGYLFIWICRKLRPPNNSIGVIEWYKERDSVLIIFEIFKVISWLFLIFVFLSGLVVPLFGEGVDFVSEFGPFYAIFGYVILSFAVMLTPLMPGSIIDVAGGFLIVFVVVDNFDISFSFAWIIAVFTIILLHYAGACAQWCIGSMRFVQFWLNRSLPPELLAASDSVLEEAGCATVGLIGYIFLDTANGLNQGRINMRFWTQLCSEWSCIPNAFAVVSLGATISLSRLYDEEDGDENVLFGLERILIPLLALIAALVQFSGLTFAARTLGKSVDSDQYMMAREKWTAVQFFYKVTGYVPSRQGWKNDVLQLAKANKIYPNEYQKCLFDDVMPLQRWYVSATKSEKIQSFMQQQKISSSTKVKLLILEKYRCELDKIRNFHYQTIEAQYEALINEKRWLINPKVENRKKNQKSSRKVMDYLIENDDDGDINQYFSEQNVLKYTKRRIILISLLITYLLTFWFCFFRIYWTADFFERVKLGIKVFEETGVMWYDWTTFGIFVIAWIIYNHYFIVKWLKNSGKQFCFMITCCRINKHIESRFKTPYFDTRQYDENGNHKAAFARSPNSTSSLPTQIDKKLYVQSHEKETIDEQNGQHEEEDSNVKDVGF